MQTSRRIFGITLYFFQHLPLNLQIPHHCWFILLHNLTGIGPFLLNQKDHRRIVKMVYKHGWDLQVLQNVINHLLVCFKVSAELKHFVKHFITNITVQMFLHVHIICCFVSALNITKLAFNFTMISFLVSVQRSQVFKRNATLFPFKMIWHMLLQVTVLCLPRISSKSPTFSIMSLSSSFFKSFMKSYLLQFSLDIQIMKIEKVEEKEASFIDFALVNLLMEEKSCSKIGVLTPSK